eukprot:CAMPEP_0176498894 /NCGR_PEP_ID=MMETSP0200_2-20121128/12605_1 /TAXON_ID=947934 /ORGANISM="Chaetoceros sp., Strain GSL56" /LENGTH=89 /DNA_ID=CAMNT_0017897213 /DNA_START=1242 /DNA_END=1511 /DNA_ORIENTATION=-
MTKSQWASYSYAGVYLKQNGGELPGIAYVWEKDEIEYARQTMPELRNFLVKVRQLGLDITVPRFLRDCYRHSMGQRLQFEGALLVTDLN